MTLKIVTGPLGPLTVRVVDDDARSGPPDLVVVLCHGFGATGTDLVPLGRECFERQDKLMGRVRFVFPRGPLSADPDDADSPSRCWWHLDMVRLQRAMAAGGEMASANDTPPGLADARKGMKAMVEALLLQTKLPMSKIIIGGFSQGAMLATDVALRLNEAPAALAILSGAPVCADEWKQLAPKRAGLKVLQSHGTHDPLLKLSWGKHVQSILDDAGLQVRFVEFSGGHGIDGSVVDALAALIAEALPTAGAAGAT